MRLDWTYSSDTQVSTTQTSYCHAIFVSSTAVNFILIEIHTKWVRFQRGTEYFMGFTKVFGPGGQNVP